MYFSASVITSFASLMSLALAAPPTNTLPKRGLDCSNPVQGLSQSDCQHMSDIGFASQGVNAYAAGGPTWIGGDGPNTFAFKNGAGTDVTLVLWQLPAGDFQAMCMNVRQAQITYSIPDGQSVTVSIQNGVSGAFAGLYGSASTLNFVGQVNNVWGEFTTGEWGTVDVSREVNMNGNHMSITVAGSGCVSEWTPDSSRCLFQCDAGDSCTTGYSLVNCDNGSQNGAVSGLWGNAASGGCQGFANGGHVDVTFLG